MIIKDKINEIDVNIIKDNNSIIKLNVRGKLILIRINNNIINRINEDKKYNESKNLEYERLIIKPKI